MGRRSRSRRNQMLVRSDCVKTLAPLMEEPTAQPYDDKDSAKKYSPWGGLSDCLRNQSIANTGWLMYNNGRRNSRNCPDLKLLVGVLGCPLGPIGVANDPLPHLSIKDVPIETSSAQYIVQQYMAATGCLKFQNSIKSSYMVGRVKMVSTEAEMATKACRNYSLKASETGCFVYEFGMLN